MTRPFSPTQCELLNTRCAQALAMYRAKQDASEAGGEDEINIGGPAMRDIGAAAHACQHQAALAEKAGKPGGPAIEAMALTLATQMAPERAYAGAQLARELPLWFQFDPTAEYEHGRAFKIGVFAKGAWAPCEWKDPEASYRMVFDILSVGQVDDPDLGEIKLVSLTDYKTGWGASEKMLESLQMKSYAVAGWKLHPDADVLEIRIVAQRLRQIYPKRFMLSEESDLATLQEWKNEVEFHLRAAQASDGKPRVGPGCCMCDFAGQCAAYQQVVKDGFNDADVVGVDSFVLLAGDVERATKAAAAAAILQDWCDKVKEALKVYCEASPIRIGNQVLAFHPSEKRIVADARELVNLWITTAGALPEPGKEPPPTDKADHRKWEKATADRALLDDAVSVFRGMVQAGELGVTQAENVLKALAPTLGYKSKAECIRELGPKFFTTVVKPAFGWKEQKEKRGK